MLVFDAKRLCLQGTDGDGERKDEVQKAKRRKGVMCEFEAKLDLDGCQFPRCKKACNSRTGNHPERQRRTISGAVDIASVMFAMMAIVDPTAGDTIRVEEAQAGLWDGKDGV